MDNTWIGFLIVVLTVIASHARLHRDIADLRERMAKLAGVVEGFVASRKTG